MRWADIKPGPMVAEAIEGFYEHIIEVHGISYIEFIGTKKPSEVKEEFLKHIDPLSSCFGLAP